MAQPRRRTRIILQSHTHADKGVDYHRQFLRHFGRGRAKFGEKRAWEFYWCPAGSIFPKAKICVVNQLLVKAKTAIIKRNPQIGPLLRAGVPADVIRKALKRAGVVGNIEEAVAVFSHFDGANFAREDDVYQQGFAPPIVTKRQLSAQAIQMLEAIGKKADPNPTIYGRFYFPRWEGVAYELKTWRKLAAKPFYAVRVGHMVPIFVYGGTNQQLALDTDPSGSGRVLSIQPEQSKDLPPATMAYESLESFLHDLIDANLSNRHLTWPARLGPAVELRVPPADAFAVKSKNAVLPSSDKVLVVRTDFSNDAAWQSLQAELSKPNEGSDLSLEFINDPEQAGLTAKQLPKRVAQGHAQPMAALADEVTFTRAEQTLLVVDLQDKPGQSFRTTLDGLPEVFDNLSLSNMEFAEFAKAAKRNGIYRPQ